MLTNAQWAWLPSPLPGREGANGGGGGNNRQFVKAVLWLARNAARWWALPKERGNWHTTCTRFHAGLPYAVRQCVFETTVQLMVLNVTGQTLRAQRLPASTRRADMVVAGLPVGLYLAEGPTRITAAATRGLGVKKARRNLVPAGLFIICQWAAYATLTFTMLALPFCPDGHGGGIDEHVSLLQVAGGREDVA